MNKVENDYHKLIPELTKIAQRASEYIRLESVRNHSVETKSKNSLVTQVDKTSENIIVDGLLKLIPEAGFIVEENSIQKSSKSLNWIVDPLDGTTNFIHGIPCYCVSIALEQDGKIVLGLILEVNRNECFSATLGKGAWLNGVKICVSKTQTLSDCLIATGFPYYDFEHMEAYLTLLSNLMQNTRGLRRMGSACADLAYVACGRFDAFFEYSLQPWDVAAGTLIVQEAGGCCYDFKGGSNYIYGKSIVCGNSILLGELMEHINQAW